MHVVESDLWQVAPKIFAILSTVSVDHQVCFGASHML